MHMKALLSTKCYPCNHSFKDPADENLMTQGHGYMMDKERCPVKLGHTFGSLECHKSSDKKICPQVPGRNFIAFAPSSPQQLSKKLLYCAKLN